MIPSHHDRVLIVMVWQHVRLVHMALPSLPDKYEPNNFTWHFRMVRKSVLVVHLLRVYERRRHQLCVFVREYLFENTKFGIWKQSCRRLIREDKSNQKSSNVFWNSVRGTREFRS